MRKKQQGLPIWLMFAIGFGSQITAGLLLTFMHYILAVIFLIPAYYYTIKAWTTCTSSIGNSMSSWAKDLNIGGVSRTEDHTYIHHVNHNFDYKNVVEGTEMSTETKDGTITTTRQVKRWQ